MLFRFVAGCIGLRFPGFERTVLPMVSCGAGCTVLICGLIWAVFGGTLLSDFFRLRSKMKKKDHWLSKSSKNCDVIL